MKSLRQDVIGYIRKTYKDEIEHPWMRYPDYGVFRHKDNQKWYGLMMDPSAEGMDYPIQSEILRQRSRFR